MAGENQDNAGAHEAGWTRERNVRVEDLLPDSARAAKPQGHNASPPAIRGIIPTVLTAFDFNEQIDDVALRAQVQYLIDAGVHGILVLGSYGECPYLTDEDREIVIRTCADTVAESVPILVGITAPSTFVAAEQIRQAHRLGASAVVVCLPQYFRLGFDHVKRHYQTLAEMDLLPVFYYHYPAITGLNLTPAQVAEILSLPNVAGIKESTLDMLSIKRHIAFASERDRVYLSGSELNFLQFMDLGGHGVVGAGSLVMPRTAVGMYQAYQSGDRAKAKVLQDQLFETLPLAKDVRAPISLVRKAFQIALRQGVVIPLDAAPTQARLKAALAERGVPIRTTMRNPLPSLSARDTQAVADAMQRIRQYEP
jgi:dihydrodipicolinate synthase/N-acetylneuraminate lyase